MRPTAPSPMSTPSYSCCATRMVFWALKPSLRAASCCKVDVVKGGAGLRRRCLRSTPSTVRVPLAASLSVRSTARASVSVVKLNCSTLAPAYSTSLPGNFCSECSSVASMVQYSRATKAAISSSRSQIMRNAGLCTRPADSPGRTFFQSNGDRLNPTRKSRARRACCAFTRSTDSSRGCAIASRTDALVIS